MANKVLCLGASGTGKSSSIRNLNPQETFIIQVVEKDLPFKSSRSKYNLESKNILKRKNVSGIMKALDGINKIKEIKTLIIDDFNYCMTYGYKERAKDKGFEKFETLAFGVIDIFEKIDSMRADLNVYFMAHTQKDNEGKVSTKTIGKFLDEKVCIEGLFTIVTLSHGADNEYRFIVNGIEPAKSPMEMFETDEIDNDLSLINKAIDEYYK